LMGFVEEGVIVGDFTAGTRQGRDWDSSSDRTMLGVVFGSFFASEESTQFCIIEDTGSDEATPPKVPRKLEQWMLSVNDTSGEAA
jgi:hypothetical protein